MYVIVGVRPNKNQVGVIDTSDKKTDWVTVNQLQKTMTAGVPVYGFRPDGTILCQTEDVFQEIATQLYAGCAKAQLLKIENEATIRQLFFNIAHPYGLALTSDDLSVSVKDMQIYFKLCGRVCAFGDKTNVVTQTGTRDLVLRKELRNTVFSTETMLELLKEVLISDKKGNTDNIVRYIGVTLSNDIFKVIIGKYVYSVHWTSIYDFIVAGTAEDARIRKCFSSTSPSSYKDYLEGVIARSRQLRREGLQSERLHFQFIDKLTKKPIKAENPQAAYDALHKKYTTLLDEYVDLDY